MPFSLKGYRVRAEDCVRLANSTTDEMLRLAILRLRQSYLEYAAQLQALENSDNLSGEARPNR